MELENLIMKHLENGLHCSQIMMQLSLDMREIDEPFTIRAIAGLSGGMFAQRTCGTLTGGACVLSSYFPRKDGEPEPTGYQNAVKKLVEWFEKENGSMECRELVQFDVAHIMNFCPGLIARTFEKCVEILEECGIDPTE